MKEDIVLTDGSILNININFLTVYLLQKRKIDRLIKKAEKNKELNIDVAANVIYCIIRSSGKEVTFEEAMILVPPDPDCIYKIVDDFKKKFEFYKKTNSQYVDEEIDWAKLKYFAFLIGMNEEEFWKCNPFEFLRMIEIHCELERSKYGR